MQGILKGGPAVVSLWLSAGLAFAAVAVVAATAVRSLRARIGQPLPMTLVLTLLALGTPLQWRDLLAPAAINLAHVLFFAGLSFFAWPSAGHQQDE